MLLYGAAGGSAVAAVISYRRANGSFETVEELEEVSGVEPKTIEKIKSFAKV